MKKQVSDQLDEYINHWIEHLQEPPPEGGGPRCPFAQKAKYKTVRVYDYSNAYSYWSIVNEECANFNDEYDLIIVAAYSNAQNINTEQMHGGVDALNTFFSVQNTDLWLVPKTDELFTIVMIQRLSNLDDSSRRMEEQGYYEARYNDDMMDKVVNGRRKIREKLK
tara:strand:+ start:412 stop:906 length:495 start_codon:yes stop_codon:yes gene_type:complete